MEKKIYETIIVGGGISGLSCAKRLHDVERDFLLITKNIGGRMLSSECFCMDYGAAYMTADYANILQYVEKNGLMRLQDFFFFDGDNFNNIFTIANIRYVPKMIVFLFLIRRFRKRISRYRKLAPHKSVKECIEEDPLLAKYWKMPAVDFIKVHGFEELDKVYGNPITAATMFVHSSEVNTFCYLSMFFPVVLKTWVVNFRHTVEKLTDGYEDKIKMGSVTEVRKNKGGTFDVRTTAGDFVARNVVLAAPQKSMVDVYNVPKPFKQQGVYVFHVVGRREDVYQNKKAIIFRPKNRDVFMVWKQENGADIVYSTHPDPDLEQYYEIFQVVKRTYWDLAMIIPKGELLEQKLEDHVYLASDYNLSSMEDSFLTGLYAANQIIDLK